MIGLGISQLHFGYKTLSARLAEIFSSGQQGAWFSPSRAILTPWYQDGAGTTPVTAVEQLVGLALDRSLGAVRGPEKAVNGNNETALFSMGILTGSNVVISRVASPSGGGFSALAQSNNAASSSHQINSDTAFIPAGVAVEIIVRAYVPTSGISVFRMFDSNDGSWFGSSSGLKDQFVTLTSLRPAKPTAWVLGFGNNVSDIVASGSPAFYIDDVTIKEVFGNHVAQATAAARPVLSSRVNLLTKTDDFASADWNKVSVTTTGGLLQETATTVQHILSRAPMAQTTAGQTASFSFKFKISGRRYVVLRMNESASNANAASAVFDLQSNIISGAATAYGLFSGAAASITVLPDGFSLCVITAVVSTSATNCKTELSDNGARSADGQSVSYAGDGVSGVFLKEPHTETGSTATRYQRVNTATDYDTAGFPSYLKFDGVDDSLSSATGGGGTAGFFFCAAVAITLAPASTVLFGDQSGNSGYIVRINSGNIIVLQAGNGTAFTQVFDFAPAVGTKMVFSCWDDGTNLYMQIGKNTPVSAARPAVAAGTSGITLGRANTGAVDYTAANIYEYVYVRNSGLTAAQRLQAQRQVAAAAGITL